MNKKKWSILKTKKLKINKEVKIKEKKNKKSMHVIEKY